MLKRSLLLITLSFTTHAKILLWDLGGVLFEPNKLGVAMEIGLSNFASHAFWDLCSPDITTTLFDVLTMMMPNDKRFPLIAGSHSGRHLPPIMSHWQAGTVTGQEIINRSHKLLKNLYKYDYFESKNHMLLISRCIHKMFNAQVLANNIDLAPEGVRLLEESAKMKNNDGTKKHRLFVFSNWDHISFDIFKKKHIRLFNMFEGIVISGHMKRVKPAKDAYDYIIETYNLDPKECVLIDDQSMNTNAARRYGMQAALISNQNYQQLRRDLVRLGVLE